MSKPISNAPVSMQPWVDATDAQLTDLENAVHRLEVSGSASAAGSTEVSSGVNSTLSFSRSVDDGARVDISNATLIGKAYATSSLEVDGPLYIGNPTEISIESGVDADGLPAYIIQEVPVVKIDPTFPRTEVQAASINAKIPSLNAEMVSDGFTLDVAMNSVYYNQQLSIRDIVGNGSVATLRSPDNMYWVLEQYTQGTPIAIVNAGDFDTKAVLITSIVTDTEFGDFSFTFDSNVVGTFSGGGGYFIFALNNGSLPLNEQARISMSRPAPTYGYSIMTPAGFSTGIDVGNISTNINYDTGITTSQLAVTGSSTFAGGYGSTGVTINTSGSISANGNIIANGSISIGGGFGSNGATIEDTGQLFMSANALSLTNGTGSIQIGSNTQTNLAIDNNDIQCRLSGAGADLFLNRLGGDVFIGNSTRGLGIENNLVWANGVYGNSLTTSYRSVYVSSTDTYDKLGYVASSRDEKKNIQPLSYTAEQILSVPAVEYHYNTEEDSAPKHPGMIAEDLHDAGLHGYVSYDKQGKPASINYEFYVSALQQVVRHQAEQIASLSARLDALEAR